MVKEFTADDDALLGELGVEIEATKAVSRTPRVPPRTPMILMMDTDDLDDDALPAELGIGVDVHPITELKHVRPSAERKTAGDIANRNRCGDFDTFKSLFEQVQKELNSGLREKRPFEMKAEIEKGRFFFVSGQKAYFAKKGERTIPDQGRTDARCA